MRALLFKLYIAEKLTDQLIRNCFLQKFYRKINKMIIKTKNSKLTRTWHPPILFPMSSNASFLSKKIDDQFSTISIKEKTAPSLKFV